MLTIIIPTCTDALITKLLMTLRVSSPEQNYQIIVADNGLREATRKKYPHVTFVDVPQPFCFSRAINLAAAHAAPGNDIVLMNDDLVIQSERFVESIEQALVKAKAEGFGVISPVTRGGVGNRDQTWEVPEGEIWLTRVTLCFVCVAIPRAVWDEIGEMDEAYTFYGFDDNDFCRRVVDAGWKLGVTGAAKVKHGNGAIPHSSTYKRKFNPKELEAISVRARDIFQAKWGYGPRLGDYDTGGPAVDRVIGEPALANGLPATKKALPQSVTTADKRVPDPSAVSLSDLSALDPWDLTRERLVELAPVPDRIFELGKDSDIESDVDLLWAIARLLKPQVTVEFGTRHGTSTRVSADALSDVVGRKFYTVDHPKYRDYVADLDCEFVPNPGDLSLEAHDVAGSQVNLFFLDVHPHDFSGTTRFLDSFEQLLARGGCVIFHDIVQNRPEIQVKEAVRSWIQSRPSWIWVEFPLRELTYRWPQGGLGLLIRPS